MPDSTSSTTPLLAEFSPATRAQWRAQAEVELKGAPFDKRLVKQTPEGLDIQPLYSAEDLPADSALGAFPGVSPYRRGGRTPNTEGPAWQISQEVPFPTPQEFNQAARADLSRGATGLNLRLDAASRAAIDPDQAADGMVGSGGVSISTTEDLDRALEGIDLRNVPISVRTGASALPFAALLFASMRKRNRKNSELSGCIEMDPLGVLSHEGSLPVSLENAYVEMAALTKWAVEHSPRLQTICVHARAWHESGASSTQELAFALAAGAEYLREMASHGLPADVVVPRMRFSFAIGSDFFMEIAKLRAARQLWAGIVAAFGGGETARRMHLHAHTGQWNKSSLDPYVNLLRTTTEAFSGALAGCDSMTVSPFDETIRQPDDVSRRLARNIQIILQEESNVGEVLDPVGGSYYAEALTDAVAKSAWALFQKVDGMGGLAAALTDGFVQKEIAKVADVKLKDLARRKRVMVGTNLYANPAEKLLEPRTQDLAAIRETRIRQIQAYRTGSEPEHDTRILERLGQLLESGKGNPVEAAIEAALAGATLGEIGRALPWRSADSTTITPVCIHRASQAFERLRGAAACFQAGPKGRLPRAFLVNLGPVKQHKARSDFSAGFLAPGGFDCVQSSPLPDTAAALAAIATADAEVFVLCSTDETYPDLVPPLTKGIKEKFPAATVLVAGRAGENEAAFRAAGVDDFIFLGADVAATLTTLLTKSGASL